MKILSIISKIIYREERGFFRKSIIFPVLGIIVGSYIIFMTLAIMNGMERGIIDRMNSFDYSFYFYDNNNNADIKYVNNGYESIGLINDTNSNIIVYVKSYEDIDAFILKGLSKYLLINKDDFDKNDVYIGTELAKDLDLNIGDEIKISSPLNVNMATKIFPSKTFTIGGIYSINIFDYDSNYIICSNSDFVKLYGVNDISRKFYLNYLESEKKYDIKSNQDNDLLLSALQFERNIYVFFGFSVIFFSSFILLIIMMIIVAEKSVQLSIINILGLSMNKIHLIIFINNLLCGLFLSLIGYVLTEITIHLNYTYNVFSYIFDSLPFKVIPMSLNYVDLFISILLLISIVALGGILPFIFKTKNILIVKS